MNKAERIIEWIKINHILDDFQMECEDQLIIFKNDRFIVKFNVYDILIIEESIYDRYSDTVVFYLHYDCSIFDNTIFMLEEFMTIVNDFDAERKQSCLKELCHFQNQLLSRV